jgi:hypothetical protein
MRTVNWMGISLGLVTLAALVQGVGCYSLTTDCDLFACAQGSGTGGSTSSSSTSASTGGGGTGGMPINCVPSASPDPVAESCGVFVSSSLGVDDMAADRGTQAKPFKSIGAALMKADVTRVYACAEGFSEAVTISAGVDLYGGLDCKSWVYVGATTKTTLTALADLIPLTIGNSTGSTTVEDFAITAASAKAPGGSSIAVLATGSTASLTRCDVTSGDGMTGKDGDPGDPNGVAANAGTVGNDGANACKGDIINGNPGGVAVANLCGGVDAVSVGGAGGKGDVANGNAGSAGQTGAFGAPGIGEPAAGAWSCNGAEPNGTGDGGDDGKAGDPGPGATGVGSLSSMGYGGKNGMPGMPGAPGQGGGGGGAAKGGLVCPANGAGASGGSGGAGGCGGKSGSGGAAGGASIALASYQATVLLTDCTLTTGKGGSGGKGGDAQAGGSGGKAGGGGLKASSGKDACDGGKGGAGGDGGPGGGGLGGHSLAIAYAGKPVARMGKTMLTPGTKGTGGMGGSNNATNAGADGVAVAEQVFP